MTIRSTRLLAAVALAPLDIPALAHDGNGLAGDHWHATDAWGLVALAVAVAIALGLSRGGKP